ncbi:MAG: phosphatidylserine decarboxylase family protein [Acidobacteria bacterium]|nr:phosphatidylserine decarboxylase family protein [Acidobacteriota bacterium]
MRVDPAGWPFIGAALALALVAALAAGGLAGAFFLGLGGFFLLFFRDPDRTPPRDPSAVVAPADGRVLVAGAPTGDTLPPGRWQQISIFLSPMDVHVNRMPVGGRVTKVRYHPGRFLPAYKAEAGDLNEYTEVWLDHDGEDVVLRQIVGILARRIVCRTREGAVVETGDRFGIMKFGSRMDVFVPETADIRVRVGDRAIGGVTVIAMLHGH